MAGVIKWLGGVLSALLLAFNLSAQTNFPMPTQNASWGQFSGFVILAGQNAGDWEGGTFFQHASGDTLIGSQSYVKITGVTGNVYALIREDSLRKVWYYYPFDQTEMLLYDFDPTIGDTIQVASNDVFGSFPVYTNVRIDDVTDTTLSNGEVRRMIRVHNVELGSMGIGGGFWNSDPLIWIEGMGSNAGLLHPAGGIYLDGGDWLTCFTHNDTVKFGGPVCNFVLTSIQTISSKQSFDIFPNPNNGAFTVQLSKRLGGTSQLVVQNTLGQIVYQRDVDTTNGSVEVKLNNVANGLYTITVRSDESIYNAKVLIEK